MYVLNVSYSKPPADVEPHAPSHSTWVREHLFDGTFLAAGPKKSGLGGVILVKSMPRAALQKLLAGDSYVVEYETTFVSAEEESDCVGVDILHKGVRSRLKASFVVGCDGAHSATRHLLALPFEGGEYRASFMLADIESNESLPSDELQLCPHESGPVAIFPMSSTRRRIVAVVDRAEGDAPSLDLVRRVLAERAPAGFAARSLHWSSYFRIHHRHTAQLRAGRIFIAGDAAHIHSPFGGQGMNTGLHDVWNLVWKIDFAVRGHAKDSLLDSYAAERLPIIEDVIGTTDLMTKAMGTPSKLAQALRDALVPVVTRLPPFQHAFVDRLSGLGIDYSRSPIVDGGGKRFFDDTVRGGKGIRSRFLLFAGTPEDPSVTKAAQQLVDSLGDVVEWRAADREGISLLRPDGYLAYWAHRSDGTAALDAVRSLLARQTQ